MPTSTRDFLEFHDLPADAAVKIMQRAGALATAWTERRMPQSLAGKRVALIVDDGGWRNTAAFDLGVQAMGGICVHVPISFDARREATEDLAGYLDNWFDLLIVRTKLLSTLQELAACAGAPVVNARTRSNHPCETLGDLAYVMSKRSSLDGLKIVGVAPDANILRSWVEASISLPIKVVQVYPAQWHVKEPALNPNFATSTDMRELSDADVILTDCWPAGAEQAELTGFQISAALLDTVRRDAIFLPCPPVARGQEVTADAMEHRLCHSKVAKAFLLHAQNALLEWIVA